MKKTLIAAILIFGMFLYAGEPNVLQKKILNTAVTMLGGEYEWGGYDPENRRFDCWSYVSWVYATALDGSDKQAGRHFVGQYDDLYPVYFTDESILKPGDVLMNGGKHSTGFHGGLYVGEGKTYEARGCNYGIGQFWLEGHNRWDPFGESPYRFCYFSLRTRFWLYENDEIDFAYAYLETPRSYYLARKDKFLKCHLFIPKSEGAEEREYLLKARVLDYINPGEVLYEETIPLKLAPGKEKLFEYRVPFDKFDEGKFVYFSISLIVSETMTKLFSYDTYERMATEIIRRK